MKGGKYWEGIGNSVKGENKDRCGRHDTFLFIVPTFLGKSEGKTREAEEGGLSGVVGEKGGVVAERNCLGQKVAKVS